MSGTEHDETEPVVEVEVHRFTALDGAFDDDDEPVAADDVEEDGEGPDVQLHGMSDFG